MLRSTLSGATKHSLRHVFAVIIGLALIVEILTAATLLRHPSASPSAAPAHTMRLVDRGAPPGLAGRIAAEMDGAVAAVSAFWGDDWPREIDVVTTGTDADFAAQTGEPARDWTGVAAVSVADRVDPARREVSGGRIVFAPGADTMSEADLRIVLRHELFHYAARADTALDAPRWLTEGVADYVGRPPGPRPGSAVVPARLPSGAELDAGGAQGSAAYDRAWWFARFVADEFGAPALRRFYLQAGGATHSSPDVAARTALGVGFDALTGRWQRWLAG
jgi:hypothetical protein